MRRTVNPRSSSYPARTRRRGGLRSAATAVAGVVVLGGAAGAAFTDPAGSAGAPTAHIAAATGSTRLAGSDRYATAADVSGATFAPGVAVAYLATGTDFPDALTAASAAGGKGPVLLTDPDKLPQSTASELVRLHPTRVVVVGGALAVGDTVLRGVKALLPASTVSRVTGTDRYDTAAHLSQASFSGGAPLAYIATGTDYPDALGAAAAAGGKGPVLLTHSDSVPASTVGELRRLGVSKIVVVGGVNAVSDAAFLSIAAAVPAAPMSRVSGADRFETAASVATAGYGSGTAAPVVYVATGQNYPDALTSAAAAAGHGPVLLVGHDAAPDTTLRALQGLNAAQVVIVGGTYAVSGATETQVRAAAASVVVAAPSAKAATAIAYARAQLGKPYQWAGAGPDSFDCSGLTMRAWGAAGVTMPHNAAAQAAMFPAVALADLQPGDLVFYGNPDIYHVGLYIGGGQMIEAAHSGAPVRIADIHRPELVGAARPS